MDWNFQTLLDLGVLLFAYSIGLVQQRPRLVRYIASKLSKELDQ